MRQKKTVKRKRTPLATTPVALRNEVEREAARNNQRVKLDAAINESAAELARLDGLAAAALHAYDLKKEQGAAPDDLASLWSDATARQDALKLSQKAHLKLSEKREALGVSLVTAEEDNKSSDAARKAVMTNRERTIRTMSYGS